MNDLDELRALPKRSQTVGEELANSISHGVGFFGALIGAPILLLAALNTGHGGFFVGTIVFVTTMLVLYLASVLYHAWPQTRGKCILQVLDHSAIFLLIAGTYTPFALGPLRGTGGAMMLGVIWAFALFGVMLKVTHGTARHTKLAMSLYLGMGWSTLFIPPPLLSALPSPALLWLVAGGIAYTIGVLFFANERLRYGHFVWHLFVLTGTSCHCLAVLACAT
jgi:hemolysin III